MAHPSPKYDRGGTPLSPIFAEGEVLDMTAEVGEETRKTSLDLVKDYPGHLMRCFRSDASQKTLFDFDARSPSPPLATPPPPSLT
ncbi:MAG: hypothetical protein U9N36_06060, partial [Euryarchaeota archaeon]|nr:hypothetical protein [Euryarchaeota archaeon]